MGVVIPMSMGVCMASASAVDMRMLVSMNRAMGLLMVMSRGVGMMSAIGMNMLMLMVVMVRPVMGMVMAMVMGVAVMRAVGVSMVMVVMVTESAFISSKVALAPLSAMPAATTSKHKAIRRPISAFMPWGMFSPFR